MTSQKSGSRFSKFTELGENRTHRIMIRVLLIVMTVEWIILLLDERWLSLFLVTLIILTLCPHHFSKTNGGGNPR